MNRQEAKAIGQAAMRVLQESDDPTLSKYDISRLSGSFGDDYMLKIRFAKPLNDEEQAELQSNVSPDLVRFGRAPGGTMVLCGTQKGKIVKARRVRYLVEGIGGKLDGRQFTYPFASTRLAS